MGQVASIQGQGRVISGVIIGLVPVTAALGMYLLPIGVLGITLYGFRLLVLCAAILSIVQGRLLRDRSLPVAAFLVLGYVWLLWGLISYYWAPDPRVAVLELVAVGIGFVLVWGVANLGGSTEEGLSAFDRGWALAFAITGVIAVWELTTGRHLESYWSVNALDYQKTGVVASTFNNPNNYAAFLVAAFPFLVPMLKTSRGLTRIVYTVLLMSVPIFLFTTQSRLGILAVMVQGVVYGLLTARSGLKAILLVCLITGLVLVGGFSSLTVLDPFDVSIISRTNLIRNGLYYVLSSFGMGMGPGAYEVVTTAGHGLYPTDGIVNPHSLWIEIVAQYGIVVLVAFVLTMALCLWWIYRGRIYYGERAIWTMVAAVGYSIMVSANSSYLEQPMNWTFLAYFVMVGAISYRRHTIGKLKTTGKPTHY